MTCLTELSAIALTPTAKAASSAKGVDLIAMIALAKTHAIDLATTLRSIVSVHPSTGPDASNCTALQAIVTELA
jgi:hypothetical protein